MSGMRLACMCGHRSVHSPAAHLCRRARLLRDSDTKDLPVAPLVLPGGTAGRWVRVGRSGTRAHLLGPSRPVAKCLCRQFAVSRCRSSAMAQSRNVQLTMLASGVVHVRGPHTCMAPGTHCTEDPFTSLLPAQARFLGTICSTGFSVQQGGVFWP